MLKWFMKDESSTLSENEAENRFLSNQWVNYSNSGIEKIKKHLLFHQPLQRIYF